MIALPDMVAILLAITVFLALALAVALLRVNGIGFEFKVTQARKDVRELEASMQRYRRESREWEALYRGTISACQDALDARERDDPNFEKLVEQFEDRIRLRVSEARNEIDP